LGKLGGEKNLNLKPKTGTSMGNIIMSLKEKERIMVLEQLKRKEINQVTAAQMLGVSPRWVRDIQKNYLANGINGILHKSRGRPSKRAWDVKERNFSISLFLGDFKDFGPTYGAEKLKTLYNIKVSKETLRKELIHEGLWTAGKKKVTYRKRRERKPCVGIMVQLDGSPHDWLESRGPRATLLVFIDDATSELGWLEFAPSESLDAIMKATLKYFKKHGRPLSFYVDYGSVFSVNTNNPEREKITQFERAMKELGVEVIHARSPQAKGRVERVNRTLQDRLTKDMRLAGISTIEAANAFVQSDYIQRHNEMFAEEAAQSGNAHRFVAGLDLHNVFCIKERRVLQNDFTISYKNRQFQLAKHQRAAIRPKEYVIVHEHLDSSISLWIRSIELSFEELKPRPIRIKNAVDYVSKHQDDELLDPKIPAAKSVAEMSLNEFLKSRESRVKRPLPAVEANEISSNILEIQNEQFHIENRKFSCC